MFAFALEGTSGLGARSSAGARDRRGEIKLVRRRNSKTPP